LHLVTRHDGRMTGPLSDLVVVDLSRALAGPHATQMLGDLGARVIKVEAPGHGDDTRGWGPPFVGAPRQSTYFLSTNRNKESIALDLKDSSEGGDRDLLLRLVDRADVLVENFRTGVLERLGLGIESLLERNPRLVVLSITGFGHDGPEGGRAGYDQIAQGEAGIMSLTGTGPDDPQRVGVPIADLLSGMYGAYGVLAALHERERTGRGQVVRTSLLAAVVGVHAFQGTRWTGPARPGERRATTTRRSRPTACSTAATARSRSPSAARGCGDGCVPASRSIPRPTGSRPTPIGSPTTSGWSPRSRRRSPTRTPSRCSPGSPTSASPRARCARSTRSTPGTRSPARDCSSTSSTRSSADSPCRVRRCGSSTPTAPR
jgi:crotonobetainyl-CoA:carnitine CoA-transferase CaiB-like acyl-CoA transferase